MANINGITAITRAVFSVTDLVYTIKATSSEVNSFDSSLIKK